MTRTPRCCGNECSLSLTSSTQHIRTLGTTSNHSNTPELRLPPSLPFLFSIFHRDFHQFVSFTEFSLFVPFRGSFSALSRTHPSSSRCLAATHTPFSLLHSFATTHSRKPRAQQQQHHSIMRVVTSAIGFVCLLSLSHLLLVEATYGGSGSCQTTVTTIYAGEEWFVWL